MKRLIGMAAVFGLLAAACAERGPGDLGPVGPTGSPSSSLSGSPTVSPTPSSEPTGRTMTYEVWFAYGEWLFVTHRTVPYDPAVGAAAVTDLLKGPSKKEQDAGVITSVPVGTRLLGLSIENGIATVDLSGGYESGGGSLSMFMRLAELTYTLTQFPTVEGIDLELGGKPVEVFSGEGIGLDHPQTREDYRDLLPPILVERPMIGEPVPNPVTVSGTADVFEATVSIRILDAAGNEIARTFTTATCGTGCRGTYSTNVKYRVAHEQPGTVIVFESSAENGEPLYPVAIPVTLTP